MAQTVVGIFDSSAEAQRAVEQLISSGFTRDNIDLSANSMTDTTTTGTTTRDRRDDDNDSFGDSISNFFGSLFGSDDDDDRRRSRSYAEVGSRGSIVTVHAQTRDEAERAADILDEYGAVDVDERASQYTTNNFNSDVNSDVTYGSTGYADTTNPVTNRDTTINEGTSIPIIEEDLQVGKRTVETGGARLRSRIVERPVEESLRLREERVRVERHAVNRPATEADLTNFQEGEIELTEHAEVPVVNKEARVVEEVSLGKDVQEREETIHDTVRRTEVDVEDLTTDQTRRGTYNDNLDVDNTTNTPRNTDTYNSPRNTDNL